MAWKILITSLLLMWISFIIVVFCASCSGRESEYKRPFIIINVSRHDGYVTTYYTFKDSANYYHGFEDTTYYQIGDTLK